MFRLNMSHLFIAIKKFIGIYKGIYISKYEITLWLNGNALVPVTTNKYIVLIHYIYTYVLNKYIYLMQPK